GRGWPFLWDARCRAPRATDPSGGAKVRPALPRTGGLPLLLGLAPGGVFPAAAVAGGAVRSYRTVSPLPPARRSGTDRRCTFCGTFPGVAPAGRYPAPYLRGARTFLSPPEGGERPSGRLALGIWEFATRVSKPEGTCCTQTAAWDFMAVPTSGAGPERACAATVPSRKCTRSCDVLHR